jgi:hypothetical protein
MTLPVHFGQVSVLIVWCTNKANFYCWKVRKKIFPIQTRHVVSCNNDTTKILLVTYLIKADTNQLLSQDKIMTQATLLNY